MLEHKWLLSERAGRDVGLDAAIHSYVAGAPAPERPAGSRQDELEALDVELDDPTEDGPVRQDLLPWLASASVAVTALQRSWWISSSSGLRPPCRFGAVRMSGSAGYPKERMYSHVIPSG